MRRPGEILLPTRWLPAGERRGQTQGQNVTMGLWTGIEPSSSDGVTPGSGPGTRGGSPVPGNGETGGR